LADLLGTFETLPVERIEALKAELRAEKTASTYWAEENAANSNERDRLKAEKKILLDKIEEHKSEIKDLRDAVRMSERMLGEPGFKNFISKRLAELEHFAASVSGLWATDRKDLVDQSLFEDSILFKIEPPKDPQAEGVKE